MKTFYYEIGDNDKTNTAPITWPSVEAPTMRDAIDVVLRTESTKRSIPLPTTVFLYSSTCIKHDNGAPAVVHGFTVTQA